MGVIGVLIVAAVLVILAMIFTGAFFLIMGMIAIFTGPPLLALAPLVAFFVLGLFLIWFIRGVQRVPLSFFGMGPFANLPAVPYRLWDFWRTSGSLLRKSTQFGQAIAGLSTTWTIAGRDENAYTHMGMSYKTPLGRAQDLRTQRPLEEPEHFKMSWTTFGDAFQTYQDAEQEGRLPNWPETLDTPARATEEFWPTIANFGMAYNLIIPERIDPSDATLKDDVGSEDWTDEMETPWASGLLYVIDMRVFSGLEANEVNFKPRFTPSTLTLLERTQGPAEGDDKWRMTPIAVRVRDSQQSQWVQYVQTDPAWLYGLQAAKASITVYGIWLGHVYQWHVVTAAMQMTMFQRLPPLHPVRQILGRQSDHLIGFDQFLLINWNIAPPTSITTSGQCRSLLNTFAAGRNFHTDDPPNAKARLGFDRDDFTSDPDPADPTAPVEDWDQYRIMGYAEELFDAASAYVTTVVNAFYPTDQLVAMDAPLQKWIKASGDPNQGNVRGLPSSGLLAVSTKAMLIPVLTSLIYRITAHGSSRMMQMANPGFMFAANFPPCLQSGTVPSPDTPVVFKTDGNSPDDAISLCDFLPNTGTIGELVSFLYVFIYATPETPFVPFEGTDGELSFRGPQATADACNDALMQFRSDLLDFVGRWSQDRNLQERPAQAHQWELHIET